MINRKGYYYSQHYNTSFLNKSKVIQPLEQTQNTVQKQTNQIGILVGTSIQKSNKFKYKDENPILVRYIKHQSRYQRSENLTFDKLKRILNSSEIDKRSTAKNWKTNKLQDCTSSEFKEDNFIRKNSSFHESAKYKVPKKTTKNQNLKACLFRGQEKVQGRSKTSLSLSQQFRNYEKEHQVQQQPEQQFNQSLGKAFIPATKYRKERQSRYKTYHHL